MENEIPIRVVAAECEGLFESTENPSEADQRSLADISLLIWQHPGIGARSQRLWV
jgi:hypothetical protein